METFISKFSFYSLVVIALFFTVKPSVVHGLADKTLVPVRQIPCTTMYTGLWYTIDLKNKGRLTWSYSTTSEGGQSYHKLQIAFNAELTSNYEKGGKYEKDAHWMFIPQDGQPGYYKFVNRGIPNAAVGNAGTSPSGKYAVVDLDKYDNADYGKDGKYLSDVLWRFENEPGSTPWYLIYNKKYESGSGILTWTAESTGNTNTKWVQIYKEGGKKSYVHDSDYLWKFTHVGPLFDGSDKKDKDRMD